MSGVPVRAERHRTQTHRGRTRVVIVDDHPLVCEGLRARIAAQPDFEVCGEASDAEEALKLLEATRPEIMIIDLALKSGNGLDLIKRVRMRGAGPKVLVVSAYEEALFAERALRAGAQGYLNKQELQGTIIEALRALQRGELYLSPTFARRLAGQVSRRVARSGAEALTDRELQVFQLIGQGRSTRSIAELLHLSVHTIETHRENIRRKLELRNGAELVQQAVLWNLEHR